MNRKLQIAFFTGLIVFGIIVSIAVLQHVGARAVEAKSLTGVWQEVGGGETLILSRNGDLRVDGSAGRYRFTDTNHIELQIPNGSWRMVSYSPETESLTWTNGRGRIVCYTFCRWLTLQNKARAASGL
jgi:hypothetical protein